MKHIFTFLFLGIAATAISSCAPVKRSYVKHDFADHLSKSCIKDDLRHNGELVIEINNINKLVYDLSVVGKSEGALMDTTHIFAALLQKVPSSATSTSQALQGNDNTNETELIDLLGEGVIDKSDTGGHKSLPGAGRETKELTELVERFEAYKEQISDDFTEIDRLRRKLSSFFEFGRIVPVIIGSECCSQYNIRKNIVSDLQKREIGFNVDALVDIVKQIQTYPSSWIDSITLYRSRINKTKDKISSDFKQFTEEYKTNSERLEKLRNIKGSYISLLDDHIKSDIPDISKDSVATAVSILTGLLNQADNSKNFTYAGTFPASANYLNVDIKAIPKAAFKTSLASEATSYSIPVLYRFEWAVGPALNFGFGDCNFDRSYTVDSARNSGGLVKTDTFSITRNKRQSMVSPSVGIMANFYWQTHWPVNPGLSLGLSTTPNDLSQLKAYLGVCTVVGQLTKNDKNNSVYNRLIFSAGLSYNRVDRLKGSLIEGENPKSRLPFTGSNIATDQLTEKVGLIGFYFGFSYKIN